MLKNIVTRSSSQLFFPSYNAIALVSFCNAGQRPPAFSAHRSVVSAATGDWYSSLARCFARSFANRARVVWNETPTSTSASSPGHTSRAPATTRANMEWDSTKLSRSTFCFREAEMHCCHWGQRRSYPLLSLSVYFLSHLRAYVYFSLNVFVWWIIFVTFYLNAHFLFWVSIICNRPTAISPVVNFSVIFM